MTIPLWVLLGFALWTLLLLATTVGVYRWAGLLTGRARFADYGQIRMEGADWYQRSMRAHANCVENLPVYGAIVVVSLAAGIDSGIMDGLALVFLGARVCHSLVHVSFRQVGGVVVFRSTFFAMQLICMAAMIATVAANAL